LRPTSKQPVNKPTNIPLIFTAGVGETSSPTVSLADDLVYTPGRKVMISPPQLYNIYYGDFSSDYAQQTMNLVDYFAANLGGSDWWGIHLDYYQKVGGITQYMVNSMDFIKSINVQPSRLSGSLTIDDVVETIIDAISSGQIPADPNAIYAFIFAGYFEFTLGDGSKWIDYWCGFHTRFDYTPAGSKVPIILKYMVMGDPSTVELNWANCVWFGPGQSANGNWGADGIVSVYAHEATETATNYMGAWFYDHPGTSYYGLENADICTWIYGDFLTNNTNVIVGELDWLVQQNWAVNHGCSSHRVF
jgi:hypothetical protein